jgi:hypothetical protein
MNKTPRPRDYYQMASTGSDLNDQVITKVRRRGMRKVTISWRVLRPQNRKKKLDRFSIL